MAYDIFCINSNKSGPDVQRTAEIMIWLEGTQKQPPSSYKSDFSDGHKVYALYSRILSDERLYAAFILKGAAQNHHSVDAKKLMDNLKLNPDWFIPGIELGNEIWRSSGKIEIKNVTVVLNGNQV